MGIKRQMLVGEASSDAKRLRDIGAAIEELARQEGFGVVTEVGGYGIGRPMHAELTWRTRTPD